MTSITLYNCIISENIVAGNYAYFEIKRSTIKFFLLEPISLV